MEGAEFVIEVERDDVDVGVVGQLHGFVGWFAVELSERSPFSASPSAATVVGIALVH